MLVMCMVMIVVFSLVVIPIMEFGVTVSRANKVAKSRAVAAEATKGGLRTALADPKALYQVCGASSPASPVALAGPSLTTSVTTTCAKVGEANAIDSGRYATAATMVGAVLPVEAARPAPVPHSATGWHASASAIDASATIWLPPLPQYNQTSRPSAGWPMPQAFGTCTVFFPGTYSNPISLTGPGSVYFASGIYYFTNTVEIAGDVDVVVGDGAVSGCASDFEAATYAVGAPAEHGITGLGATFVFGGAGRMALRTPLALGAGTLRVRFNQRYVPTTAQSTDSSAGVSIMTANGALVGTTWSDVVVTGVLAVPKSSMQGQASPVGMSPSTLVAQSPLPAGSAVVEADFAGAQQASLQIPGYVAVPQSALSIWTHAATKANKTVRFDAGATAAMFDLTADRPSTFVIDIVNPVVQRTFMVVSTAVSGVPVTSTAEVIVNQNGAYAISSWTVQ